MYKYCLKTAHVQLACVHVHPTRHADTPDTLNIGTVVPLNVSALAPATQTPQTLEVLSTACRVQISRISDTQTTPVRNCTFTSNHTDTPDTWRSIYRLKSTHVQSARVHVHRTRHTDTPDTLNIGALASATQTPQTLQVLSTAFRIQISRISDTQTTPVRNCTLTSNHTYTPDTWRNTYRLRPDIIDF